MSSEKKKSENDFGKFVEKFGLIGFGSAVRAGFENAESQKRNVVLEIDELVKKFQPGFLESADVRLPLGRYSEPKTPEELSGIGRRRVSELLKDLQKIREDSGKIELPEDFGKIVLTLVLALDAFDITDIYDKRAASSQFRNLRP